MNDHYHAASDAPLPIRHDDGTITAELIAPPYLATTYGRLALRLPAGLAHEQPAGRYWLARLGAQSAAERYSQWQYYFRRPLFATEVRADTASIPDSGEIVCDIWYMNFPLQVALPHDGRPRTPALHARGDDGYAWLAQLPAGASLNLLGPLGRGFRLQPGSRNYLLAADEADVSALLPLIDPVLDAGGRVALLVRTSQMPAALVNRLPLAVEVHGAATADEWASTLHDLLPWADQLCAVASLDACGALAHAVRHARFHLEAEFAQVLVNAPLYCGIGACLACVVPLASGGLSRACIHGPVFDLSRLAE